MHTAIQIVKAPTIGEIEAAANRLETAVVCTPLLESPALNERLGGRLLVKAECLQKTGAFKYRGAYNTLSQIAEEKRAAGVVAFSSGNHGQAVAAVAKQLSMPCWVVMPEDAPDIKVRLTQSHGATVVFYNRATDDREAIAAELAEQHGATVVPSFDHPHIIAGQGTTALEILAQANAPIDLFLAPMCGGGLMAGCATVFATQSPQTQLIGVEPLGYNDTQQSLAAGHPVTITPSQPSLCDCLMLTRPGDLTFAINQPLLNGVVTVGDDDVLNGMAEAFHHFKIVTEPGGVAALAAVLCGKVSMNGQTVAVVVSGGNVDPSIFKHALETKLDPS